ncbi:hypothetical protein Tco_0750180 [Tanacetum coccineum]|uniref:Uncharacterized protein n=1 Tax=Tanacetum coccineum TaxID=301880 RepID=A0ABQ4Z0K7_9ASTR
MSHPNPKRNFVPRAVLMKSGLKTLNTARQTLLRSEQYHHSSNVSNRVTFHMLVGTFNKFTTNKNNNFNEKVNTIKGNVTTVGQKVVVSNNNGNEANAIKAVFHVGFGDQSKKVLDHVSRHNGASMNFKSIRLLLLHKGRFQVCNGFGFLREPDSSSFNFAAWQSTARLQE